jgi:photosystem II stability/assembly factor-like uncharacterized protein
MTTTMYLATEQGVSVVQGSGENWEGATHLREKKIECVLIDPLNSDVVYCGTFGAGLFETTDGGTSWTKCASLPELNITALAADGSGRIYAGTEPSNVFRSGDAGETWEALAGMSEVPGSKLWSFPPRPYTHHVKSILPDPMRREELHVAVEAGALLRNAKDGKVWSGPVKTAPKDTHWLVADPVEGTRLFSAAGDGFFESDDDGNTWRRSQDGLDDSYCWSTAISSSPSRTLVMSAAASALGAHYVHSANAAVYRREMGASWSRTQDGLPTPKGHRAAAITAHPFMPGEFFLSTEGTVFRSTDDARHWEELKIHWENGRAGHAAVIAVV